MPAVPRRPGPRLLGSGLSRPPQPPGERRGLRGRRAGSSTPRRGPARAMGPPQRWARGEPAAWVSPGRRACLLAGLGFCFAWLGFVSSYFGILLFLKSRGLQSRCPTTPASCSGPDSRGHGEPAAPSPRHNAHGSTRPKLRLLSAGSSGTVSCPRLPERSSPGSSPRRRERRVCAADRACARCGQRAQLSLPAGSPRRRDLPPLRGFPVAAALAGVPRAQLLPPARWSPFGKRRRGAYGCCSRSAKPRSVCY